MQSCFANLFSECIKEGILVRGGIFVVDNCSIHCKSDNEVLQDVLWDEFNILLITLPPYHPELNPIEQVFHTVVERLQSLGCNNKIQDNIVTEVRKVLNLISHREVKSFYRKCGYYK